MWDDGSTAVCDGWDVTVGTVGVVDAVVDVAAVDSELIVVNNSIIVTLNFRQTANPSTIPQNVKFLDCFGDNVKSRNICKKKE